MSREEVRSFAGVGWQLCPVYPIHVVVLRNDVRRRASVVVDDQVFRVGQDTSLVGAHPRPQLR